jgi:hypothetical protein
MKHPTLTPTDLPPPDPRINQQYFNAKYRDWLKRRGLTDPSFRAELEQMDRANTQRRNRTGKK